MFRNRPERKPWHIVAPLCTVLHKYHSKCSAKSHGQKCLALWSGRPITRLYCHGGAYNLTLLKGHRGRTLLLVLSSQYTDGFHAKLSHPTLVLGRFENRHTTCSGPADNKYIDPFFYGTDALSSDL